MNKRESSRPKRVVLIVDTAKAGARLDRFLAGERPERSRGQVQRDVRAGHVTVSGTVIRQPSYRLQSNDEIVWILHDRSALTPAPIHLDILYEDDDLVAVDKPTGLVVHPGAGTDEPTLVEGLLWDRSLPPSDDPVRPGIVHRLDKETSGVLVVAKTSTALSELQRQFAARSVTKSYLAVVRGTFREEEGTIDAPVGRDPASPRRMSVCPQGRVARTEFRVLRRLGGSTLLLAQPRTGRTHQLRVHLSYIGHPVVGDTIYGPRGSRELGKAACDARPGDATCGRTRAGDQAERLLLHAWRLTVRHPGTEEPMTFEAPVPAAFPSYPYREIAPNDRAPT